MNYPPRKTIQGLRRSPPAHPKQMGLTKHGEFSSERLVTAKRVVDCDKTQLAQTSNKRNPEAADNHHTPCSQGEPECEHAFFQDAPTSRTNNAGWLPLVIFLQGGLPVGPAPATILHSRDLDGSNGSSGSNGFSGSYELSLNMGIIWSHLTSHSRDSRRVSACVRTVSSSLSASVKARGALSAFLLGTSLSPPPASTIAARADLSTCV